MEHGLLLKEVTVEIKRFIWNIVDTNSWLIVEQNKGLLIDAVDSDLLFDAIADLDELIVILTHAHFDHIAGLNTIRQLRPDAKVMATASCSRKLGNKYKNMSSTAEVFLTFYHKGEYSGVKIDPITCDPANMTFENVYEIAWCGHRVKMTAVFGHSDDGLIAAVDDTLLFSGDTLLNIPTATRLPSGNGRRFWFEDVPMLRRMSGIQKVYPGHGDPGKLEDMLAINNMPERYRAL